MYHKRRQRSPLPDLYWTYTPYPACSDSFDSLPAARVDVVHLEDHPLVREVERAIVPESHHERAPPDCEQPLADRAVGGVHEHDGSVEKRDCAVRERAGRRADRERRRVEQGAPQHVPRARVVGHGVRRLARGLRVDSRAHDCLRIRCARGGPRDEGGHGAAAGVRAAQLRRDEGHVEHGPRHGARRRAVRRHTRPHAQLRGRAEEQPRA
mmetsp:Transcript_12643/g.32021  ORF Transcript_12643/g.32021 Transcript_12643/m.32021 type:complete len:210 (-) Transcript_12643:793-1422(-)